LYLIQLFLPLRDNAGRVIARRNFDVLTDELTLRFGGMTSYSRAPAKGLWKQPGRRTQRDDVIVYEVQSPKLERRWWHARRLKLQKDFRQQEILIRAQSVTRL
jgi:hypothetical protein